MVQEHLSGLEKERIMDEGCHVPLSPVVIGYTNMS